MIRVLGALAVAAAKTALARLRGGRLRPTWSFELEVVVRFMRADFRRLDAVSPSVMRAELDGRRYPLGRALRAQVSVTEAVGCPVPGWWLVPTGAERARGVLLYFHGGAFLFGSTRTTHYELLHRLAIASGRVVLGIDYRLAPEHVYPAALDDAAAALAWLSSTVPLERVVLGGDSAGGNLSVALLQRLGEAGAAMPAGAVLISPWVDMLCETRSATENEPFDVGTAERLRAWARLGAGGLGLADPRLSVGRGPLAGLPPLLVQWGEAEVLADDCTGFADRAAAAGLEVKRDVLRDLPHDGTMFALVSDEAARGVATIGDWVQGRLP